MTRRRPIAALAIASAALLALAGCGAQPAAHVVTAENPSADTVTLPAGSVDKAVEQLPDIAKTVLKESGVPGMAIAVVHNGKTVFAQGYGVRTVGGSAKVDKSTVFQIASLSKPIAATVVATQVSKKVIDWNTPAASHLPGFALGNAYVTDNVTVGDLFAHRSGLPPAAGDDLEDLGYDRTYILDHLKYQPLSPFRTTYAYANFGLTAGAEAVANAAGTDWATLSEQALYKPLGMTSTSSRHSDFIARSDRTALNAKVGSKFEALYQRDADPQSPAGGVSSNVVDLAKWMNLVLADGMLDGKQLIAPAALNPAITSEVINGHAATPSTRSGTYGYGFNVGVQSNGQPSLSHSGAFSQGAGTAFTMLPGRDLGIVVLTNGSPVGAAESVAAEFIDLAQYGSTTRNWYKSYSQRLAPLMNPAGDLAGQSAPSAPAPAAADSAYVGSYQNPYFGVATVTEKNGALVVALGPNGAYTLPLTHWDGNTFSFVPTGENAPAGSKSSATFTMTAGTASAMTLQFFNGSKLGTWTR